MTLGEFKWWLDGFEHSFVGGAPSAEQYSIILRKIYAINEHDESAASLTFAEVKDGPITWDGAAAQTVWPS